MKNENNINHTDRHTDTETYTLTHTYTHTHTHTHIDNKNKLESNNCRGKKRVFKHAAEIVRIYCSICLRLIKETVKMQVKLLDNCIRNFWSYSSSPSSHLVAFLCKYGGSFASSGIHGKILLKLNHHSRHLPII